MRDRSKNEKYYEEYIAQQTGRIAKFESKIADGTVASDRVGIIRAKIDSLRYSIMVAKYSNGTDLDDIRQDYLRLLNDTHLYWNESSGYSDMLVMMSLAILFNIDKSQFTELSSLVDKYNRHDPLLDFFIDYAENNQASLKDGKLAFPDPYKYLTIIIKEQNDAIKHMNEYMTKRWLKVKEQSGEEGGYCGLWCFEVGAIAKILGIDDTALIDEAHYPYDLVHY